MSISDKEYYQLTVSIGKALYGMESPLKLKHARAAIIGTFHTQGAHSFWAITLRQPLQENRITAWKFCHLLHKVLREGHSLCCQQSMRHRGMLSELGKLWGHLNDGYGLCIRHYTKLLITKLEFHDRNPRIPGNLALKRGELEAIGGNDVNFYFEMAVEMFDYLDDIISLQATIFSSITTFHVNSMTSAGQCRLAPLIPLIQDSNQLYDFLVRIMFKLHGNLPNDVLQGHRDRFRAIFTQLKSFYNQARNLQYFVNLITVPKLPELAPNFGSQTDFGEYQAPVVVVPEPPPEPEPELEPMVSNLVDTDPPPPPLPSREQYPEHSSRQHAAPPPTPAVDFERIIHDRDDLIRHLQTEVDRLGKCLKMITVQNREEQSRLDEHVATLNSQLSDAHEELTNMRFVKEELELKAQTLEKTVVEEEKLKANEEKFHKLKVMYTAIRDEHVKLLRQHGEVSKQLATCTKIASEATKEKEEMRTQFEEVQLVQNKVKERLQQSSADTERVQSELAERVEQLQNENSVLSAKFDDLTATKENEIEELRSSLDKLEEDIKYVKASEAEAIEVRNRLSVECEVVQAAKTELAAELHRTQVSLQEVQIRADETLRERITLVQSVRETEETRSELTDRVEKLQSERVQLSGHCTDLMAQVETIEQQRVELTLQLEEIKTVKEELDKSNTAATSEIERLTAELSDRNVECVTLKEEAESTLESKAAEINELTVKLKENEQRYQKLHETVDRLNVDKDNIETDLQDLLHEQEQLAEKHSSSLATITALEVAIVDAKIRDETRLRALIEACVKSAEKLTTRAMLDDEVAGTAGTSAYFMMQAEELQSVLNELVIVHAGYVADAGSVEGLARKVIVGGHLMATVHVQGMTICNTLADIECGERITDEMKLWSQLVLELFRSLLSPSESGNVGDRIADVKRKLSNITTLIHAVSKKPDSNEAIADSIESELLGMDKAIEEAAARIEDMLSKSRASDKGIKLEVNEKILDACTALMNNIRFLVQKSRLLQAEIVSLGKGTASAKEFYKRNHQWTEGLISAAKSVAQGANFLVTAANKAVSGDSKHQLDLIVAAQEIAACTAQLVVSSRVKAPRGSVYLSELGKASRDVTQATGGVVATVKDCSQRLEDSQDLDLTNLTVHQAKTLEMEIQVKVLELEQSLQTERHRLAAFRRKNYRES